MTLPIDVQPCLFMCGSSKISWTALSPVALSRNPKQVWRSLLPPITAKSQKSSVRLLTLIYVLLVLSSSIISQYWGAPQFLKHVADGNQSFAYLLITRVSFKSKTGSTSLNDVSRRLQAESLLMRSDDWRKDKVRISSASCSSWSAGLFVAETFQTKP